jgi:membrane-associated phospholipid phosphatase
MHTTPRNWVVFFALSITACLILLSWGNPLTTSWWDKWDIHAFYFFNGWVAHNHAAQIFWSIANYRPFDFLLIAIMLGCIMTPDFFISRPMNRDKTLLFFVLIAVVLAIRYTVSYLYGEDRISPSGVLSPAYLLPELVPYIHSKGIVFDSFPSDHAAILFAWTGFLVIYAKKWFKPLAVILGLLFCLPRLVTGAHWISDMAVGSLFIALLSIAIVCFTPFGEWCVHTIRRVSAKCYISRNTAQ